MKKINQYRLLKIYICLDQEKEAANVEAANVEAANVEATNVEVKNNYAIVLTIKKIKN